jgi:hypothetical protein
VAAAVLFSRAAYGAIPAWIRAICGVIVALHLSAG